MAFTVYVSLLPFRLQAVPWDVAWGHFAAAMTTWPRRVARANFLANLLLFVPIGFGLAGAWLADRPRRRFAGAVLVALPSQPAGQLRRRVRAGVCPTARHLRDGRRCADARLRRGPAALGGRRPGVHHMDSRVAGEGPPRSADARPGGVRGGVVVRQPGARSTSRWTSTGWGGACATVPFRWCRLRRRGRRVCGGMSSITIVSSVPLGLAAMFAGRGTAGGRRTRAGERGAGRGRVGRGGVGAGVHSVARR